MESQLVAEEISHERRDLPDHLIGFADETWAVWRCVAVRGAGFPARQVLELASPETAAAAARLLDAEEQSEQARLHALDLLRLALDSTGDSNQDERGAIFSAISRLKKGKLPKSFVETGDAAAAISAFKEANEQLDALQTAYSGTFTGSFAPVSRSLVKASQDKRFREAVIWQNREALHTGIERLLTMPITDGYPSSVRRNRERLVANYLQRYCTKNDTIGFFGPLGWARFASDGDAIDVRTGVNMIAARNVSFESWAL
ncbi:MAG TPA: lantibiotic dehydratase, partial [Pyrinomonadaceae bacterium]|nr:lantibiotic dehydratase [Pyrinomonadaceae bacterium]